MPLIAYNQTGAPVTLAAGNPPPTLPTGTPVPAVNVTGALAGLSGADFAALEAQRPNTVFYMWTEDEEYSTNSLITFSRGTGIETPFVTVKENTTHDDRVLSLSILGTTSVVQSFNGGTSQDLQLTAEFQTGIFIASSNGFVGINNLTPAVQLDVVGVIQGSSDFSVGGNIVFLPGSHTISIAPPITGNTLGGTLDFIAASGTGTGNGGSVNLDAGLAGGGIGSVNGDINIGVNTVSSVVLSQPTGQIMLSGRIGTDITFLSGSPRAIGIEQAPAGSPGYQLSVKAGEGAAGFHGGDLFVSAGNGGPAGGGANAGILHLDGGSMGTGGQFGGSVIINGTAGDSLADSGNIRIGDLGTTFSIQIGAANTQLTFFGNTPHAQVSVAALTNNVTAGGVNDVIANYTDLIVYSNDAAAIRNDIYQLARKLAQVVDGLRVTTGYNLFA